jgi:CRISPR-associated endoribonuclease Cas6
MPVSILIHFFPQIQLSRSASSGKWLHGLVFNLFNRLDPQYAQLLHEKHDYKPFTLSPLLTKGKGNVIHEGQMCQVRLTLLDDEKISDLLTVFTQINQEKFILGNAPISIEKIQVSSDTHKNLTRYQTWQELLEISSTKYINLCWHSPTAIKQKQRNSLFPIPETIFYLWQKRWEIISPLPLPKQLNPDDWFNCSQVSNYQLQTSTVYFGNFKQKGFKGTASYEITGDETTQKLATILSHFAFYCGTGYKTTIGMGQTSIITQPKILTNSQPSLK